MPPPLKGELIAKLPDEVMNSLNPPPTFPLETLATHTLPIKSIAIPPGAKRPPTENGEPAAKLCVEGLNSLKLLGPDPPQSTAQFAIQTSPSASTAIPVGALTPPPVNGENDFEAGSNSLRLLPLTFETQRLPDPSAAMPNGL